MSFNLMDVNHSQWLINYIEGLQCGWENFDDISKLHSILKKLKYT